MTQISISLYEALGTLRYTGVNGAATFDYDSFLSTAADLGIRCMKLFCDLNYFWDSSTNSAVFVPQNAVLPYKYLPAKKTWDFNGQLNQDWEDRIQTMIQVGQQKKVQYVLCLATQGPDYGSSFFTKMGYGNDSKNYYDRANFQEFINNGAWGRFQKYHSDIYGYTESFSQRFQAYEAYNEGDPGVEELQACRPAQNKVYQFCMPRPIPPNTKINVLRNVCRIDRFAFHGVFTPQDVVDIVADCAKFGIQKNEIWISTDGATPWYLGNGKYKYTTASHQAHYKDRINWNKNPTNKQGVIDAHKFIRDKAVQLGVAVADFQSVLKWSQNLTWTPDAKQWATAILV